MKKHTIEKYVTIAVVLLLAILFIAKASGPSILRLYVESGMGGVEKQPIFSTIPQEELNDPAVNAIYLTGLTLYHYPDLEILLPKKFGVVKQTQKKIYYKKWKSKDKGAMIYISCKKPDFFTNLFPRVKKQGINNNYAFIKSTMYAQAKEIKNTNDAFFTIMKSIFTPDMGKQDNLKIIKFTLAGKKGFLTYNLGLLDNYFDCNFTDKEGNFFKVYFKDKGANLDLEKVFTVISTVKKLGGEEIVH
ncbi:MAG: hypothetical protein MUC39_06010 [Candidatus Omnitrophica bacterium]|nr:hypothetical protein [Candidatus Omnitrophota bacterium]